MDASMRVLRDMPFVKQEKTDHDPKVTASCRDGSRMLTSPCASSEADCVNERGGGRGGRRAEARSARLLNLSPSDWSPAHRGPTPHLSLQFGLRASYPLQLGVRSCRGSKALFPRKAHFRCNRLLALVNPQLVHTTEKLERDESRPMGDAFGPSSAPFVVIMHSLPSSSSMPLKCPPIPKPPHQPCHAKPNPVTQPNPTQNTPIHMNDEVKHKHPPRTPHQRYSDSPRWEPSPHHPHHSPTATATASVQPAGRTPRSTATGRQCQN
jgi:hypothetical protein